MTVQVSKRVKDLLRNPDLKDALEELLYHHSLYVNDLRDHREKLAQEAGMDYKDFMTKMASDKFFKTPGKSL
jgi:hypothetical protein